MNKLSESLLKEAYVELIGALVGVQEFKDTYTVMHENIVARLSVLIAQKLCLERDFIVGLALAAYVHDIGKMSIPSELLVKREKLTPHEFDILRSHPQAGFDILKDINFPWPIAEIVFQHHERMNGNGYPNRLVGNEIHFQARIIAVADTLHAIARARPYREGRGIEVAMDEISAGKGTFFDEDVVTVCELLFKEDRIQKILD